MSEKQGEDLDSMGPKDQKKSPDTSPQQEGFSIRKVPDTQKDIIQSFGGTISPYIDAQGRSGVRIKYPDSYNGIGRDIGGVQSKINGTIEIDGNTKSIQITGPLPFGSDTMFVQIFTEDYSGRKQVASITFPKGIPQNNDQAAQIGHTLAQILSPKNQPASIMQSIDYIVANAGKLTQEQVIYFRNIIGYVIHNNTGLDIAGYDRNILSRVYLKYGPKHQSIQNIDYQLNHPNTKPGSAQQSELLRWKGEILSIPPTAVDITSTNWQSINFPDPYWLKRVK